MAEALKDGTGSGRLAKVNFDNRLEVEAIVFTGLEHISEHQEESFYLASDFVALTTTASFNAIFYVKNNENKDLHLYNIRSCGEMGQQWKMIKNPTAGTLVSDANAGDNNNINFKSTNVLEADVYGASGDGKTITDGTQITQWINGTGHSTQEVLGAIILAKGDSIALTCKPATAGTVCVNMLVYLEEEE